VIDNSLPDLDFDFDFGDFSYGNLNLLQTLFIAAALDDSELTYIIENFYEELIYTPGLDDPFVYEDIFDYADYGIIVYSETKP